MAPQHDVQDLGKIRFTINGKSHTIKSDIPPSTTLVTYLREWAQLPGTKALCHEGGCGICTAVATKFDFELNAQRTFSFKTCQTLVYACAGWDIETIEYIGNNQKGYHPLQKAVKGFYGTQCGYCTPGFIMTMYGKLKANNKMTMEEIEKSLDGNLCRCTGYRPILDSFKSFAIDAPPELSGKLIDIEEAYKKTCSSTGKTCEGTCSQSCSSSAIVEDLNLAVGATQWYRPISLNGLYKVLQKVPRTSNVRLVVGNTGQGVFKEDGPFQVYIDTTGISDLYVVAKGHPLKIGANVSLTRCIELFHELANDSSYDGYNHLEEVAKHWEFVANVGVRNVGSWVGNIAMKQQHPDFPSDIFLTLAAIEATLQIGVSANSSLTEVTIEEFSKFDMTGNVVLSMTIPPQKNVHLKTYKITQRAVNSHAYINAAFRIPLDSKDPVKIASRPGFYFGGVRPDFVRAVNTEKAFIGKSLTTPGLIKAASKILQSELRPDSHPADASPEYRTSLSQSLLYKAVLDLIGNRCDPEYQSGGPILVRPLSTANQIFDENKESWPIGQPIPKIESDLQVSGGAEYVNDIPSLPNELHGAFVQTTVANAELGTIDASEALKINGVVDFITAKDIKGPNTIVPGFSVPDVLFVENKISYAGQGIGLILAKRRDIALRAVKLVKVTYKNIMKPVLTIREALKHEEFIKAGNLIEVNNTEEVVPKPDHVITGVMEQPSQYHFYMEPLTTLIYPKENCYEVWATTQWKAIAQKAVAEIMNLSSNRINMTVRRLGGGYGGKITRTNIVACAAAVACQKLNVPIRIVLPLDVNMTLVGWREPYYSEYTVGISKEGLLKSVDVLYVADGGFTMNETAAQHSLIRIPSVYYADQWKLKSQEVKTNTASTTWCRTPGSVEAIGTMENIIEHIADFLKKPPLEIRELNFATDQKKNTKYGPRTENLAATQIVPLLKQKFSYDLKRQEIDAFNKENRWRKKGLSIIPMLYPYGYPPFRYTIQIAIYEDDGTIAITHGGVEMGQGINTKVAQMVAKVLSVPLSIIDVKASNNFVGANSSVTGGSYGSDLCAHGAEVCATKLNERLRGVSEQMEKEFGKAPSWKELVAKAKSMDIDLSERYWTAVKEHPQGYEIYGGCAVEVEVDVLTGQFIINKAEVVEDCGKSMSPFIDIGQVEGSVIMGFGLYTTEVVRRDETTGQNLSNGTWQYKIPTALDIPVEFNVTFLSNAKNPFGVVGSKASGEPAVCLSYAIVTALRDAIKSARVDAGNSDWFNIDPPLTVERIQQLCLVNPLQYNLKRNEEHFEDLAEDFDMVQADIGLNQDKDGCYLT